MEMAILYSKMKNTTIFSILRRNTVDIIKDKIIQIKNLLTILNKKGIEMNILLEYL